MEAESSTIYLVDDDASVRRGLTRLLNAEGFRVRSHASAEAFLEEEPLDSPACLVLDLSMPGMSGLDLQHTLLETGNSLPIIFITARGDIPTSVRAMKAGAVDFLPKPFSDHELLAAIGTALNHASRQSLNEREANRIQERVSLLTEREREVMEWVIGGFLNKQIAAELGAAEKTIKVHRGRVMKKMEAESVAELVRLCDKAGIPPRGGSRGS